MDDLVFCAGCERETTSEDEPTGYCPECGCEDYIVIPWSEAKYANHEEV